MIESNPATFRRRGDRQIVYGYLYNWWATQEQVTSDDDWGVATESDWTELLDYCEFKVNGMSNLAPPGFRLPTNAEWDQELATWDAVDYAGYYSALKLCQTGIRNSQDGIIVNTNAGHYQSSSSAYAPSPFGGGLVITRTAKYTGFTWRAFGRAVRCIKDESYTGEAFTGGIFNGLEYQLVTSLTGRVWLDRNLGATRVATSYTDSNASGWLYQWGRLTDGHEKRTSSVTATLSTTDIPGHGDFILSPNSPYDWRNPQNDNLWQDVSLYPHYSDWYFPAIDEVILGVTNLGLGVFAFASSTEDSATEYKIIISGSPSVQTKHGQTAITFLSRLFYSDEDKSIGDIWEYQHVKIYDKQVNGGGWNYKGALLGSLVDVRQFRSNDAYHIVFSDVAVFYMPSWSNITDVEIGVTAQSDTDGIANTAAIIAQLGHTNSVASFCQSYAATSVPSQIGNILKGTRVSPNGHPRWDLDPLNVPLDTFNMSVYPAGRRNNNAAFVVPGSLAHYYASINYLGFYSEGFAYFSNIWNTLPGFGFSVRLVRDATSPELLLEDGDFSDNYVGNDGKIYKTVKIGKQVWTTENLAETKYRNGTSILKVADSSAWIALDSAAYCAPNNNEDYAFGFI